MCLRPKSYQMEPWDPACKSSGTYHRPLPVRVDGFNVEEKRLHFAPWVQGQRRTIKHTDGRVNAERLVRSVTPTVSYGGEFEHRVQGAPQVGQLACERRVRNRTKSDWLRSRSSTLEEDEVQLLGFRTCRFVQEIGQQAAHYSLVAHDQDIFLPFKLHDDWFQTMNQVLVGLGYRQNVPSEFDSFVCQTWAVWNVLFYECKRVWQDVLSSYM